MDGDIHAITETQRHALEEVGVVLLYAHGSVAEGAARDDSDVDIAALFERAPADSVKATSEIIAALHGFEKGREMDVAILNTASPLLAQRVASRGALLYARSPSDELGFRIRAMHEYESSRRIARIGRDAALARANI
ncbi:MAG: nucleotidyltransferase domain-containing protein [bacterium]|nr:nucleotidyltransferase domain-containing protein [bacterium]